MCSGIFSYKTILIGLHCFQICLTAIIACQIESRIYKFWERSKNRRADIKII
jgi:hypothetical protein